MTSLPRLGLNFVLVVVVTCGFAPSAQAQGFFGSCCPSRARLYYQQQQLYLQQLYQYQLYQQQLYQVSQQQLHQQALLRQQQLRRETTSKQELVQTCKPAESVTLSPEQKAAAKLKLARTLLEENLRADAEEYCRDIVNRYAETEAAGEAQLLLQELCTPSQPPLAAVNVVALAPAVPDASVRLRGQLRGGLR